MKKTFGVVMAGAVVLCGSGAALSVHAAESNSEVNVQGSISLPLVTQILADQVLDASLSQDVSLLAETEHSGEVESSTTPGAAGGIADSSIEDVALATSSVAMTYPVRAKLFGVFATTFPAQARVASDGSVAVEYPWYSFLFSSNQAELLSNLEMVGHAIRTLNTQELNTSQQIVLLGLMHQALVTSLTSETSGESALQ